MKPLVYRWLETLTLSLILSGMLLTFASAKVNNTVLYSITAILLLAGFVCLAVMGFVSVINAERQED